MPESLRASVAGTLLQSGTGPDRPTPRGACVVHGRSRADCDGFCFNIYAGDYIYFLSHDDKAIYGYGFPYATLIFMGVAR